MKQYHLLQSFKKQFSYLGPTRRLFEKSNTVFDKFVKQITYKAEQSFGNVFISLLSETVVSHILSGDASVKCLTAILNATDTALSGP